MSECIPPSMDLAACARGLWREHGAYRTTARSYTVTKSSFETSPAHSEDTSSICLSDFDLKKINDVAKEGNADRAIVFNGGQMAMEYRQLIELANAFCKQLRTHAIVK